MSGNIEVWETDREFSIVLDNLLELEHEKLQNSILEKSVFGSVTQRRGDGEGASPSVVLAAITRGSLPPGSEVLQKVMRDIRSHPYNSWTTPYGHLMDTVFQFRDIASSVNGSKFDENGTTGSHLSRRSTCKLLFFCKVKLWQVLRLCSKLITFTIDGMEFRSQGCTNVNRSTISRTTCL